MQKLTQLREVDPAAFKVLMGVISTQLKESAQSASGQTGDQLNALAGLYDQARETGELPPLHPSALPPVTTTAPAADPEATAPEAAAPPATDPDPSASSPGPTSAEAAPAPANTPCSSESSSSATSPQHSWDRGERHWHSRSAHQAYGGHAPRSSSSTPSTQTATIARAMNSALSMIGSATADL
jgi:hypothetical protein